MSETRIETVRLSAYKKKITKVLFPSEKKTETNMMKIGSLAPQGIKPHKSVVILRSFSLSKVRVAMIAGTEHPKPIKRGMKERPESPNRLNILSMTKATRAI